GLGQYVVAKRAPREVVFQATVLYVVFGVVAFAFVVATRNELSAAFGAPGAAAYVPILAASAMVDRVSFMPERVLVRDMRFRIVSISRSIGEVCFGFGAVLLAWEGFGGWAIVVATIMRSAVRLAFALGTVDLGEWVGRYG